MNEIERINEYVRKHPDHAAGAKIAGPYERCGPDCVAEAPLLDTADGREHDECPLLEAWDGARVLIEGTVRGVYGDGNLAVCIDAADGRTWVIVEPPVLRVEDLPEDYRPTTKTHLTPGLDRT